MKTPHHNGKNTAERITWGPFTAVMLTLLFFFAAQFLGAVLLIIIIQLMTGVSLDEVSAPGGPLSQTKYIFLGNAIISVLLAGFVFWFLRYRGVAAGAIGLKKTLRSKDIGLALAGYAVYFIAFYVLSVFVSAASPELLNQEQDIGFSRQAEGWTLVPIFISLVIIPPLVEELITRGFLYSGLRTKLPVVSATIITSILFALAHLQGGKNGSLIWLAAADTFILSVILCFVREKTGRLWAPIFVHGLKNAMAFAALFIFAGA